MAQVIETGRPILVDLLTNQAGTFLVSRLPLRDDAGEVIGAIGLVLLDHPEIDDAAADGQVQRACSASSRTRSASSPRSAGPSTRSPASSAPARRRSRSSARRGASRGTDSTVLLLGETGTGKELLAHAHPRRQSARAARAFVGVNIAAVPETLLEAEFFGVAPGAYTGADRKGRDGKFKLADGGTLFLDEIGDMPLRAAGQAAARAAGAGGRAAGQQPRAARSTCA